MSVRSRAAVLERPGTGTSTVEVAKVFGNAVPPAIEAAEAAQQMTPASPFSPGTPIGPYDGYSRTPRSREYVTGYNIATRPRLHERVSFEVLKGLIRNYDVAQICIRHRIASIRSLTWKLVAADHYDGDVSNYVDTGMEALWRPDRKTLFRPWLSKYVRGILSFDAGTLYRMRNRAGRVVGLKVIDGTTIAPLLDYWGDPPDAPAEAYVQFVNGLPWNWLTADDLIYQPFDPQDDSIYGRAPLEDILLNANTDVRFQVFFLQYFTEGNIPEAFASAPESWTPDQIEQFQELWDGFMYGDQSRKHQIRWIPGGSSFAWTSEKDFDDKFSLFLMRKTCASYLTVPSDLGFTEDVNRSSGESQADVQHRVGDLPLAHHVQDILSAFLQDDLQLPLKFAFDLGEEQDDRVDQANADKIYWEMGAVGSSEIREWRYGRSDPVPVPRTIMTSRGGPVPINSLLAVAGEIDPATALPAQGSELPHKVFGGVEGVLPNPPIRVMSLAEQEFGESAMPPAPPPQPKMQPSDTGPLALPPVPVAKEGEGAPAAGITADTGIYGDPLIRDEDDDEDTSGYPLTAALTEAHSESIAKEVAAFRRFARARRRAGQWRDFEFEYVAAAEGRRLNAEGRASVAKGSTPGLTSRSGMISLDLPEGLIDPVPGGVTDHHVTVVYLGPDVDDEAFAAACDRAKAAAAMVPGPLDGTISGVGCFPPSASSDEKIPAWAAVAVPGAERLREALADLSASEFRDWQPHVTLAYLEPGDPLPAPLEPVPVSFAWLSVHRGESVRRFPFGGSDAPPDPSQGDTATCPCGIPVVYDEGNGWQHADGSISHDDGESVSGKMATVAKAGGARPKGADWPGWKLDLQTAAYWGPKVTAAAQATLTRPVLASLAAAYIAAHPGQDGSAPGKRDRNDAAAAWLASRGVTVPMGDVGQGIVTDGYMIGAVSAQAMVNGQQHADTSGWQPGNTDKARQVVEALGLAAAVAAGLGGGGSGTPAAGAGQDMGDGYLAVVARVLAGWDPDVAADELADMLGEAVADGAYAEALTVTQITAYSGQAALDYYLANTDSMCRWVAVIDSRTCPRCLENAAADARKAGEPWPSGDVAPPAHPGGCRCALVPDWA